MNPFSEYIEFILFNLRNQQNYYEKLLQKLTKGKLYPPLSFVKGKVASLKEIINLIESSSYKNHSREERKENIPFLPPTDSKNGRKNTNR